MKPKGKVVKKNGEYVVEGDTNASNVNYYKDQIQEMKDSEYGDALEESIRTASERLNQAKDGDPELPRLEARLKHLRDMSSKNKK